MSAYAKASGADRVMKLVRDAEHLRLYEGSRRIQRVVIARSVD